MQAGETGTERGRRKEENKMHVSVVVAQGVVLVSMAGTRTDGAIVGLLCHCRSFQRGSSTDEVMFVQNSSERLVIQFLKS